MHGNSWYERYDPHIRLRTAGQLLSLLQFDFSEYMLAKLEAYERDLALYEQASGEKISDGLRVGIVLNRVTDTELATHLLLNSERFQTWALFRRERCGCLACKGSSVGSLPDASLEPMTRTKHRWRSTHCNSTVTRSATRAEDSVTSRRTAGRNEKQEQGKGFQG